MIIDYKGVKLNLTEEQEEFVNNQLLSKEQKSKKEIFKIDLCHIGGYELLRDGTKIDTCKSLNDFFETFFEYCDYDENEKIYDTIVELINEDEFTDSELFKKLENIWKDEWNEGGGSGWFEVTKDTLNEGTFLLVFKKFIERFGSDKS